MTMGSKEEYIKFDGSNKKKKLKQLEQGRLGEGID